MAQVLVGWGFLTSATERRVENSGLAGKEGMALPLMG